MYKGKALKYTHKYVLYRFDKRFICFIDFEIIVYVCVLVCPLLNRLVTQNKSNT